MLIGSESPRVEIVSPARYIERDTLSLAVGRATQAGILLAVSPGCHLRAGQFAGGDDQRAYDFTRAWTGDADTLWAARGGYGTGRLATLLRGRLPALGKSFIGYSDQTYLLAHIARQRLGKAVHGPMPVDLLRPEKRDSVDNLLARVERRDFALRWKSDAPDCVLREGAATGHVVVGNLSVLTRLIGTPDEPEWTGAILFVEDVEEYLYALDRMFLHLAQAGILGRIAGLVLGAFTDCKDNETPFGRTVPQIALDHLKGRDIPVAAGAPFGHGAVNEPIVFGAACRVTCSAAGAEIEADG